MIRVHLLKNTCEALGRPLRCWPGANHIFAQGETAPILLNFLIYVGLISSKKKTIAWTYDICSVSVHLSLFPLEIGNLCIAAIYGDY
jgi:hypothetical protein